MWKHINLMLGSACDRHCGYCLQANGNSPADKKADPVVFTNGLADLLDGSEYTLAYWGGEPMVYFEKIKAIHKVLKDRNRTPKRATITTHGRSLTDEYIEFANSNPEIWTTVSLHDYDFTEEQMDRIFRLDSFSFSDLITHKQLNTDKIRNFVNDMWDKYDRFPHVWVHFVRANDSCGEEYYLTKEDVDIFYNHLVNDVLPLARIGDAYSQWLLRQLMLDRINKIKKPYGAMCVSDGILSIDLHGNKYQCHHNFEASNICGNIFKRVIPIYSNNKYNSQKYFLSKECQECELLDECRGGCYISNTHEVDCYLVKKLTPILKMVKRGYCDIQYDL